MGYLLIFLVQIGYGKDAEFSSAFDRLGYLYVLDIHYDQTVYLECLELKVLERKSTRGAVPKRLQTTTESIGVSSYMNNLKTSYMQKLYICNSAKGKLTGLFHFAKVYIWDRGSNLIEPRTLVI